MSARPRLADLLAAAYPALPGPESFTDSTLKARPIAGSGGRPRSVVPTRGSNRIPVGQHGMAPEVGEAREDEHGLQQQQQQQQRGPHGAARPAGAFVDAVSVQQSKAGKTSLRSGSPKAQRAVAQVPKQSYRGLSEALSLVESEAAAMASEDRAARNEARALRSNLLATEAESEELAASTLAITRELHGFRSEAAELWSAHETPLREQEDAICKTLQLVKHLKESAHAQFSDIGSLREECEAMGQLGTSLYQQLEQSQMGHETIAEKAENAQCEVRALEVSLAESETRMRELQGLSRARTGRLKSLEAEAATEQFQLRCIHQELQDMDQQHHSSISSLQRETVVTCEGLRRKHATLCVELENAKQLLQSHGHESDLWREQAYRHEAALAALHGTDLASGLRSLSEQCTKRKQSNMFSGDQRP